MKNEVEHYYNIFSDHLYILFYKPFAPVFCSFFFFFSVEFSFTDL